MQKDIEINEHYSDEILQINNTLSPIGLSIPLYSYSYITMVLVLCKIVIVLL